MSEIGMFRQKEQSFRFRLERWAIRLAMAIMTPLYENQQARLWIAHPPNFRIC